MKQTFQKCDILNWKPIDFGRWFWIGIFGFGFLFMMLWVTVTIIPPKQFTKYDCFTTVAKPANSQSPQTHYCIPGSTVSRKAKILNCLPSTTDLNVMKWILVLKSQNKAANFAM